MDALLWMHYEKRRVLEVAANAVKKHTLPGRSTTSNALRRPTKKAKQGYVENDEERDKNHTFLYIVPLRE